MLRIQQFNPKFTLYYSLSLPQSVIFLPIYQFFFLGNSIIRLRGKGDMAVNRTSTAQPQSELIRF